MPTPIAKPAPAQARLYALGLAYLVGNVITTPSAAAELYSILIEPRLSHPKWRKGDRIVPPQTASVQLSENANADVEKGRPSRSRGQDFPLASMPLRTRRVPSAGINTVHTP